MAGSPPPDIILENAESATAPRADHEGVDTQATSRSDDSAGLPPSPTQADNEAQLSSLTPTSANHLGTPTHEATNHDPTRASSSRRWPDERSTTSFSSGRDFLPLPKRSTRPNFRPMSTTDHHMQRYCGRDLRSGDTFTDCTLINCSGSNLTLKRCVGSSCDISESDITDGMYSMCRIRRSYILGSKLRRCDMNDCTRSDCQVRECTGM
ncbi:MAG: hypothetical protein L6R36_006210 [Xanthoria steineri]|nr:MAG: hypothetical protein L6R36_006210 [Xanthoria steineri]